MYRITGLFLAINLVCSVDGQGFNSRSCSSRDMRECRDSITRSIQKRINDMPRIDMTQHCGVVRENFNCLLRETRCLTSDSDVRNNADILRKGLVYIRDGCDTLGGGFKDSQCYIGDDMKNCENRYPLNSGQYSSRDVETCRQYNLYQQCVMDVLKNRCRPEDDVFVGQFLVTKVQELAWSCGDKSSDNYRDRDRDYGGGRYGGSYDRSDSDRDRDRGRDRDRNYDRDSDRDQRRQGDYGTDRYSDRYDSGRYGSSNRNYSPYNNDITCCREESCDSSRMRRCSTSLSQVIDDRGGYQDEKKCRKVRDNFNCLLWQTTCLPREERDRSNNIFHKARDYISRYCDTYGRWSENSCYKSSDMQRCETALTTSRSGANFESCRAYNNFRSCMEDELRRRCTREDDLLQGSYLVEKAQEMSWQCGTDRSGSRGSNDRYNSGDRYNDRSGGKYNDGYDDRYDRRDMGSFDNPSYGSYEDQPLDRDDETCLDRLRSSSDTCQDEMNEKKRQLITENDYNRKLKGDCCAAIQFRRCLNDASRRICMQLRSRVVDKLLGQHKYKIQTDNCRNVYDSECSAANGFRISALLFIAAIASLLLLH